jgi:hypothetical protein
MFKLLKSVVANLLMAFFISLFTGFSVLPVFGVLLLAGVMMHIAYVQSGGNLAFDGLATQVWISDVMQNFYPDNHFLTAVRDLSSLVDNNTINLAEAGADPDVLVNNTVYPVGIVDVGDNALTVPLKTYDTQNSVVRNAVAIELAYDQRALYVSKHQKAMLKKMGIDAAWAYAPTANDDSKFNKVLNLGANDSIVDALIDMQAAYGNYDADSEDRIVVFSPNHMAKIAKENKVLYKAIMAEPGSVFYGFKVFAYSKLPFYLQEGTKAANGAAFSPDLHKQASITFLGSEVCKAMGTMDFFSRLKDPEARGDIFGYQARFTASSFRNKYMGAILQ